MNAPPFGGTYQPLNNDGGFLDEHFGVSMPWSPDTSMGGYFQQGVGSTTAPPPTQWNASNMIWDPSPPATSMNECKSSPNQVLPAHTSAPPPPPAAPTSTPRGPNARHQCTHSPCTKTFKRDYERIRHEASVHRINRRRHLCPITGCSKSHGKGYTRSDKVTEHLWKKHANLGYTKA